MNKSQEDTKHITINNCYISSIRDHTTFICENVRFKCLLWVFDFRECYYVIKSRHPKGE